MCNQRIRIYNFLVLEFGNLELASSVAKFLKALRKFGEKSPHPNLSISCESNFRMIKVELFVFYYLLSARLFFGTEASTNLDRPFWFYVGGKIARVKVSVERAYEENKLRRVDLLFNLKRTQIPDVNLRNGL